MQRRPYCRFPQCDQSNVAGEVTVTNGAIVIHTQRLKSDPGGNLLS
ncbi:chemotaxis protein [Salmonella enterica subsp. enterica serovar Braenderup]|nr:chemotaxis protein [Salmonella enterica subsp. enterica serovar Braenderup]